MITFPILTMEREVNCLVGQSFRNWQELRSVPLFIVTFIKTWWCSRPTNKSSLDDVREYTTEDEVLILLSIQEVHTTLSAKLILHFTWAWNLCILILEEVDCKALNLKGLFQDRVMWRTFLLAALNRRLFSLIVSLLYLKKYIIRHLFVVAALVPSVARSDT